MTSLGTKLIVLTAMATLCCVLVFNLPSHSNSSEHTTHSTNLSTQQSSIISTECSPRSTLCGVDKSAMANNKLLLLLPVPVLKQLFHQLMTTVNSKLCRYFRRFGHAGDGGYDVCMTSPFKPVAGNCLVYSFGISVDWTFDETMAEYGCQVHSFDPSIGLTDHIHSPGVYFHNVGLWGSDLVNQHNWTLNKLSTIRRQLGHQQRVIDVLKVDVEGAEWPFLRNVVDSERSELATVRQLILETHSPRTKPQSVDTQDMLEIVYYASRLVDEQFTVVRNRQVNNCCGMYSRLMPDGVPDKCCYETFYVNKRFPNHE